MAYLYINPQTDSLYLDITRGDRSAVDMAEIAEGVFLHVDETGSLIAIEVMDLSKRGGLRIDDLDAQPGSPRPALFEEIEKAANRTLEASED
jgi:uncharacterized protein YuzE